MHYVTGIDHHAC